MTEYFLGEIYPRQSKQPFVAKLQGLPVASGFDKCVKTELENRVLQIQTKLN